MEESSPRVAALQYCLTQLEARCAALAAENAGLKAANAEGCKWDGEQWVGISIETPATDAFLAEVRAQAHKEGAHFVANRMLAAWDAGFIDDTAKNAADIARMILTSTEFMADAPEGDFDRSFADGVLEDIAAQIRKGVQS
ncbi:ead/Ea22-like family protein [Enterobacter hormaechei]|nr:ead/Ea22-like family protein [Enterobacter hormaechei]EKU5355697.1 ead/Ea22-like family protein [Enterobacter hormaechei]ELH1422743.1 ead/Ea22-like family protein [Enterobacter hormaechei]MBJ6536506.1 ead/Ea22-like family protein [Enterobacter hormaechei]QEQ47941.1 ead/Ea22-like family protein [Enterobacter hormaechei]HCD2231804.1 ead/Ea22-like family protein [Enterobacter hormaechei]